jgi:DNA-binding transcriptional MerR regulator
MISFSLGRSPVNALRHYDEVGLLPPALVDTGTGYRHYRSGQLREAGIICALRGIDLPIDAIRRVLDDPSDGTAHAVLAEHRDRLAERAHDIERMSTATNRYLENGLIMPETTPRACQVTINATDLPATVKSSTRPPSAPYVAHKPNGRRAERPT